MRSCSLLIYACIMFSGAVVSYFFIPETLGKTLEELSNEDQMDFIKRTSSRSFSLLTSR